MTAPVTHRRGRADRAERPLAELARRHGVLTSYVAADGTPRRVGPDVVAAVLAVLGVDVDGPGGAGEAWRAAEAARADQVLPPVVVHRLGHGGWPTAAVTLPRATACDVTTAWGAGARGAGAHGAGARRAGARGAGAWVELATEGDGDRRVPLAEALGPAVGTETVDGRAVSHHRLSLARLGPVPAGYHRLTVELGHTRAEATVVVAPRRCPRPPRTWGLTAPVYALRGPHDGGVGTLADLGALADWSASLGAGITGTLPLYAAFLDGPALDPSPYRPVSRLAWNEVFIDLAALPELAAVPAAAAAIAAPAARRAARRLAELPQADLPAVLRAKRRVLEPLAVAVLGGTAAPDRRRAFDRWAAQHPDIVAYARFRATGAVPTDRAGARPVRIDPTDGADVALAYHCYAQWVADEQLAALARRTRLYLDLPVGVHPRGFDPVWEPEAYVGGASIGAPPDPFFAGGQDWGLPPLHPEGSRRQGHRHLAAVLRTAMRRAAVVRLDHVMGLHRLWFVPDGHAATDGAYVRYPADELRAVVVLEAHRAGTAVVGEDLGTVPDAVRRAMAADGMLRSAVWEFDASPDDPWPAPPAWSLASLATHDLPPFAAFLTAGDGADPSPPAPDTPLATDTRSTDTRSSETQSTGTQSTGTQSSATDGEPGAVEPAGAGAGAAPGPPAPSPATPSSAARRALRRAVGGDVGRALRGCLLHLAGSPARVVLVDLADLWLERTPQNVPGSTGRDSFRLRARRTLDELRQDDAVADLLRSLSAARRAGDPTVPASRASTDGAATRMVGDR